MDTGAPFVYRTFSSDGNSEAALLRTAMYGNLGRIKGEAALLRTAMYGNLGRIKDKAFRQKEHVMASKIYTEVIGCDGLDATLYSNRSLCKLKLGDGKGALSHAYRCRMLRPDCAKAFYR